MLYICPMENITTKKAQLDLKLKRLEIKEKQSELDSLERRLANASKGIIIDQINTLSNLLSIRSIENNNKTGGMEGYTNCFDEEDQVKIKAKIMRLINTF